MATITKAVFQGTLPWDMIKLGVVISILLIFLVFVINHAIRCRLSILGIAMGMYLPLTTSLPLLTGGMVATVVRLKKGKKGASSHIASDKGVMIACGLVSGSAVMDVLLAVPFSMMSSPDIFRLVSPQYQVFTEIGTGLVFLLLVYYIYAMAVRD
jgi:uncharacterized oligopeptide transporter (OPT) family protein